MNNAKQNNVYVAVGVKHTSYSFLIYLFGIVLSAAFHRRLMRDDMGVAEKKTEWELDGTLPNSLCPHLHLDVVI